MASVVSLTKDPLLATVRVSSVLNRDSASYGKTHLFDGSNDTCWNSDFTPDATKPQWILLEFACLVQLTTIKVMFQGGFSGKCCELLASTGSNQVPVVIDTIYPSDSNSVQIFYVKESIGLKSLRIVFKQSSDLYGRIIIYNLDVEGYPVA